VLEAFERQYLARLTTEHRGNVNRAARTAGKERRDLGKLLKRNGLDPRQFASLPAPSGAGRVPLAGCGTRRGRARRPPTPVSAGSDGRGRAGGW
jgi:hypothetical protein